MPQLRIHASENPILKIFSNDFVFRVPFYQRPYAWTTEQAEELLDDLLESMGEGDDPVSELAPYFLGSIVLVKEEHSPHADIIDGQQRLTTLAILLSAIRALVGADYASSITGRLYERGDPLAGTPNRYRLTLRERDAEFFRQYIQDEGGLDRLKELDPVNLPDPQKNIQANALLYLMRLEKLPEVQRVRLAQYIVQRCYLVVISNHNLASAYRIFSVLNDRGLDLSTTDILKAEIIGALPSNQQDKYTERWESLEEELGREDFEDLFAHMRTIYRKIKLRNLLDEFRNYIKPQEDPVRFIDEVLEPYAAAFITIRKANYESSTGAERVNFYLRWLNRIDNVDWIPPAILYLSRYQHNPEQLAAFFCLLERLAAGMMILRANINQRIERYGRLLTAIEADEDLFAAESPLQLTEEEQQNILERLNGDLYLEVPHLRTYVLLRLDSALSGGGAVYNYPIITVEHVLPQHPKTGSQWEIWFPNRDLRERWVHKLGNLVLLARRKNSQARNYEFEQKKRRYFTKQGGVSSFTLTTQVLQESKWTPEVIERRQRELLEVLRRLWHL